MYNYNYDNVVIYVNGELSSMVLPLTTYQIQQLRVETGWNEVCGWEIEKHWATSDGLVLYLNK